MRFGCFDSIKFGVFWHYILYIEGVKHKNAAQWTALNYV